MVDGFFPVFFADDFQSLIQLITHRVLSLPSCVTDVYPFEESNMDYRVCAFL